MDGNGEKEQQGQSPQERGSYECPSIDFHLVSPISVNGSGGRRVHQTLSACHHCPHAAVTRSRLISFLHAPGCNGCRLRTFRPIGRGRSASPTRFQTEGGRTCSS